MNYLCMVKPHHLSSHFPFPFFFSSNTPIQLNNFVRLCLHDEFLHPGCDELFRSCNIIELESAEKPAIDYSKEIKIKVKPGGLGFNSLSEACVL